MKTIVIGLGNPILGDDAIGWRVVEAAQARLAEMGSSLPMAQSIEVDYQALGGISLMERLIGYDRAIVVDALQTGAPIGTVSYMPIEALPNLSAGHTTAVHDTSLQDALTLGRSMGAELPKDVTIVGIEAERVYEFSETLSPQLAAAIPMAVKTILSLLSTPIPQTTTAGGAGQPATPAVLS